MKTILCDIDGTLANIEHRLHHIKNGKKNWDKFHAECVNDTPIEPICVLARILYDWQAYSAARQDHKFILISGRSDIVRKETEQWLSDHHIWYDDLIMRPHGNYIADDVLKEQFLDELLQKGHEILFVIEDRQRVVDMWRRRGLVCLQAASWEEESYADSGAEK